MDSLFSQEHYDLMVAFERQYRGERLDKEKDKAIWKRGNIYENGEVNKLFLAFRQGYEMGRATNS